MTGSWPSRRITVLAYVPFFVLLALVPLVTRAAVELALFEGHWESNRIVLEWATGLEIDHGGFNLYRHTEDLPLAEVTVQATKLNDAVILEGAMGITVCTPSGNEYHFEDTTAIPGQEEYHYWLESINCSGGSEIDPDAHIVVLLPQQKAYLPVVLR